MRTDKENIRLLKKLLVTAVAVLCVDLIFAACSSDSDSVELIQEEEASETVSAGSAESEETVSAESAESEETVSAESAEGEETAEAETDAAEAADAEGSTETEESGSEVQTWIYVHVCGAVKNPGVYMLPEGTRVFEAVEAAGGFSDDADESYVNQALILEDQDRLMIPTLEQTAGAEETLQSAGTDTAEETYGIVSASDSTGDSSGSEEEAASGLVNLNTAGQEELETLPGIGAARAAAIISYREENGAFSSTEEIQNVSGIGEAIYSGLKDLVTVD